MGVVGEIGWYQGDVRLTGVTHGVAEQSFSAPLTMSHPACRYLPTTCTRK